MTQYELCQVDSETLRVLLRRIPLSEMTADDDHSSDSDYVDTSTRHKRKRRGRNQKSKKVTKSVRKSTAKATTKRIDLTRTMDMEEDPVLAVKEECWICQDELAIPVMMSCQKGHYICATCLPEFVKKEIERKQVQITCQQLIISPHSLPAGASYGAPLGAPLGAPCQSPFMRLKLDPDQERKLHQNNIEAAIPLQNQWHCSFCSNIMAMATPMTIGVIQCSACSKSYCLQCKNPTHPGTLCPLPEEKQMIANLGGFYCPRKECKAGPFSHASNCNHMTCPTCKQGHWCGKCGDDISRQVYADMFDHFCDGKALCVKEGCKHCPMFPR